MFSFAMISELACDPRNLILILTYSALEPASSLDSRPSELNHQI